MSTDWSMVAERICTRRKMLNMSRGDVAEEIGKTLKYYSDIERGSCGMSIETLVRLTHALNMSADYILNGLEEGTDLSKKVCKLLKKHDVSVQKRAISLMNFYLKHVM